jgi:putative acetyltransferase
MFVRPERPEDVEAVHDVVGFAFASAEKPEPPIEVALLKELRGDAGWLPKLSLVAVIAGEVVGHVVCTRGRVDDSPALGLGPLAVRPDRHQQGVGKALMHAVLGAADALDEPLVVLLGDPGYYHRYGFVTASELGIYSPDPAWGRYFQARPLSAYQPIAGKFAYAEPFDRL